MLRGENIICGTSTTGTGTLTLAACPASVGGVDPYTAFHSMGLGTANGVPCSYTIIEYADTTFAKPIQLETGAGLLTFGASITGCTLTRSTPIVTQPSALPTYNYNSPAAVSFGTAAGTPSNTLVMLTPQAANVLSGIPPWYWNNAGGDGNTGLFPLMVGSPTANVGVNNTTDYYIPIILLGPVLARFMRARVQTAYTGGTSNIYGRIYAIGTDGRPGKLLCDFDTLGNFATNGAILANTTSAPAYINPVLLTPGMYIANLYITYSGGTGSPALRGGATQVYAPIWGSGFFTPSQYATANSETTSSPAPDPANLTSWTPANNANIPLVAISNV